MLGVSPELSGIRVWCSRIDREEEQSLMFIHQVGR